MTSITPLTSADNPRIKAVARLLDKQRERQATGLFVVEGPRLVHRAIQAGLAGQEFFLCPQLARPEDQAELAEIQSQTRQSAWYHVTPTLLSKMAYRENPSPIVAVFQQRSWTLDDMARQIPARPDELWLVAVGLTKPGNLGAMMRTACAAGATGLLVADGVVDPFNPNAIHASTGAAFVLPTASGSCRQVIDFLDHRQVPIYAAMLDATEAPYGLDWRSSAALVIGPEDTGLDEHWRQAALAHGRAIRIPMPAGGGVDSLNASNAAAILLFEAVRQRQRGKTLSDAVS